MAAKAMRAEDSLVAAAIPALKQQLHSTAPKHVEVASPPAMAVQGSIADSADGRKHLQLEESTDVSQ